MKNILTKQLSFNYEYLNPFLSSNYNFHKTVLSLHGSRQ